MKVLRFLDLDFTDLDVPGACAALAARDPAAPFGYVVTPNADHLVRLHRQPTLRAAYAGAALCLLDSRVIARAARLFGLARPRVCPGSDLVFWLLSRGVNAGEKLTIIGLRAAHLPPLCARFSLVEPAHFDPPMGFWRNPAAIATAVAFVLDHPARWIFLAVGSPGQEILAAAIAATGRATGTGLCIGASLEFLTGARRRAPGWMQRAGLEWLHRLASEPRRMARRYLVEDPFIFLLLLRERQKRDQANRKQESMSLRALAKQSPASNVRSGGLLRKRSQ